MSRPTPGLAPAALRRRLLTLARPVLPPLALSALARLTQLSAGIALLGTAGWALGRLAVGAPVRTATLVWVMVALSLVKGGFRYAEQFCGHLVAFRALALLRVHFFNRLEPQAPAAVAGRASGDLLARVTKDVDRIEVFFAHTLVPAVTAVVVPAGTVVVYACLVSPWGALALAVALGLVGAVIPQLGAHTAGAAATQVRARRGTLAQHVTDSVQGVREVVGFGYQGRRLAEQAALEEPLTTGLTTLGHQVARRRGLNLGLAGGTLLAELAILTATGVGPPGLLLGLVLALAAFPPALAVEDFAADLQQAYAAARRFFQITDAVPLVPDPASPGPTGEYAAPTRENAPEGSRAPPPPTAPTLRFDHVTFTHPDLQGRPTRATPALDDVTFTARPGALTALVGASGSGKSTAASLAVRAWDPDAGVISLDGTDIRTFPLTGLRADVGLAAQHPYLFRDTIAVNLRLAKPTATEAEIIAACHTACFDEVLAELPDGLATDIGESGERLSGGQRQRLALARTLLAAPAVLLLDEVTSQLDAATEARVLARLRPAVTGKTTLYIAHRLSTVRAADWIVVLDAGRVVQQGTYDALAAAPGAFADLLARE
ncbi:MAG: ABC transporter ATP-binding protein/permease [Propionibacteriaceae bacterium]|jgi:ABC-type transport system involved in cytochrome bd biosynthesis fused ATPase/permease subunit|nr:ABC transporter ATP-binding protein/permease [Propionibacteriaceae bacterium]